VSDATGPSLIDSKLARRQARKTAAQSGRTDPLVLPDRVRPAETGESADRFLSWKHRSERNSDGQETESQRADC
jgi:hypothetical protein